MRSRPRPVGVQAKALRDAAGIEEEQAQAREAEATALLAEASEAREEATGLRTEADAFIARAQAAEALAAEYRALAEHPPSAQIATHYLYDPAGRLLGEYDDAGQVEREYVYLEGMPLALMAPSEEIFTDAGNPSPPDFGDGDDGGGGGNRDSRCVQAAQSCLAKFSPRISFGRFLRAAWWRSEAIADAIPAQASRLRVQAEGLCDAAEVKEQQAPTRERRR